MKHCKTHLSIEDLYCPDCGDGIEKATVIKPVIELHPDIIDELRKHCPTAKIYTGWVEKTYHYKRRYKTGGQNSQNLFYSYWFLTLNNEKDQQYTISIDSEDSSLVSVVKDDVITILMPTSYSANHPLADKNDADIVDHNELAPVVVFHRNSGQESIREPGYNVDEFSKFGIFVSSFLLSAVIGVIGLYFKLYDFQLGVILSVISTIILTSIRINRRTEVYNTEMARLAEIKSTTNNILDTSIEQMGYDQRARKASKDDVYCHGCDKLICNSYEYCSFCGVSQVDVTADAIAVTNTLTDETHSLTAQVNDTVQLTSIPRQRITRQDKILQVCDPLITYNESSYLHKHVLVTNFPCTIITNTKLFRVTDKEVKSDVSDNTSVSQTTTRTDYKDGYGSTVRSEYHTTTTSHRQRDSNLYGELTIETPDGEIESFKAAQSLLGSADVGDWILLGTSKIQGEKIDSYYDEFYFNINKNNMIEPETAENWSRTSQKSQTIIFIFLLLAIASSVYFYPAMNIITSIIPSIVMAPLFIFTEFLHIPVNYSPIILFIISFLILLFIKSKFNRSNKTRRIKALQPLYATLEKCQSTRDQFLNL